jgi:hypothetical protein
MKPGFNFGAYHLDSKKIWTLPLNAQQLSSNGSQQPLAPTSTTVGEFLEQVTKQGILEVQSRFGTKIKTTAATTKLEGPSFVCDLVAVLAELHKDGINFFSSRWCWFDSDSVRSDAQYSNSFFVVSDDKIVRENVSFGDYANSGFDPSIFLREDDADSIWFNDRYWREALTRLWYQKFYSETRTGQLMVVRPDEPPLYHYNRPQTRDVFREVQSVVVAKIYRLLWVALLLLAAIAFPSFSLYLGIASIVTAASLFWYAWSTRKVGESR